MLSIFSRMVELSPIHFLLLLAVIVVISIVTNCPLFGVVQSPPKRMTYEVSVSSFCGPVGGMFKSSHSFKGKAASRTGSTGQTMPRISLGRTEVKYRENVVRLRRLRFGFIASI